METDQSLWIYFINAGAVVKVVMLLLVVASIISWTFIFQRGMVLRKARQGVREFAKRFWSGVNIVRLYQDIETNKTEDSPLSRIFHAGFKEFIALRKQPGTHMQGLLERVQRAMRITHMQEIEKLQIHLPFLASVGSTSPYVGLLGTVWGIMTAFHALGSVQQASIALVAPGIAEALIATAMGLFAAIPAVLAYNRYSHQVDNLQDQFETFQEALLSTIQQQAHTHEHPK